MNQMRPELELLLQCASLRPNRDKRLLELLSNELDLGAVISMAQKHSMIPYLYWSLNATFPEKVPSEIKSWLKEQYKINAKRSLVLGAELIRILDLFKSRGIEAVAFKGPTLDSMLYGNNSLRTFDDLDIIVHKRDVLKAKDALLSLGFLPDIEMTQQVEAKFIRDNHEYNFHSPKINVDIHWQVIHNRHCLNLKEERIWDRFEIASLRGKKINVLSAEDLLLYLCIHGTKHHWSKLMWLCDLAHLIYVRRDMDWYTVIKQTDLQKSRRVLYLGLFLAADLLGAPVPESILIEAKANASVLALAAKVIDGLNSDQSPGTVSTALFWQGTDEDIGRNPVHILKAIRFWLTPTSSDLEVLHLPGAFYLVYYLIRPIRLIRKYMLDSNKRIP